MSQKLESILFIIEKIIVYDEGRKKYINKKNMTKLMKRKILKEKNIWGY